MTQTSTAFSPISDVNELLAQLEGATRVVLDLDGTLYDTRDFERPALTSVAEWLRVKSGQPLPALPQAFWQRREADRHRPGLFDALLQANGLPVEWGRECAGRFHAHPGAELEQAESLKSALQRLRGADIKLALVTNGAQALQQRKLQRLGLEEFFDVRVYCDPRQPQQLKPSGWAWQQLSAWRAGHACTHVGDDPVDAAFASAGQARFIAFLFRSSKYED